MAQWVGCHPADRGVAGLVCSGYMPGLQAGSPVGGM